MLGPIDDSVDVREVGLVRPRRVIVQSVPDRPGFRFRTGEKIRRSHLERGKALLAGSEIPMSEVARRAGFSDSRQLSVVFGQETGLTPTAYRRQFRGQE